MGKMSVITKITKKKPKEVKLVSVFLENPNSRQKKVNKSVFEILNRLSLHPDEILSFYFQGLINFSNGRKLIKRMAKDKLIKIKKDKFYTKLNLLEGGKECLNKLRLQPFLKE